MSRYHTTEDTIKPSDLSFTLDEFLEFLNQAGRYNTCPLCGNSGEWEFMTEQDEDDEYIAVYSIIRAGSPVSHSGVAMMTCLKCGFAPMTNLVSVYNHFRKKSQ